MSINKINLKQIDANFSGLVGEYGSGYFVTNSSFDSLSGASVKYTDIQTGGFIYDTGNQSIYGVKNFLSRPQLSGKDLITSDEALTVSTNQSVLGQKTFLSDIICDSNYTTFQFSEIEFTESNLILDYNSANSLVSNLGSLLVNTTSNQLIGGSKNFTSLLKVNNTGVLLSGAQNPAYIQSNNTAIPKYLTFVEGSGDGSKMLQMNTGLSYNASTNTLSCRLLNGAAHRLSGKNPVATINGLTFDGSTDIVAKPYLSLDSADSNKYLVLASGIGNGYKDLYFTSNIGVNPSSNYLSASAFIGEFSGNALNATSSAGVSLVTLNTVDTINFKFAPANTVYQMSSAHFSPISDNTKALGQSVRRWSIVYAGTSTINTSDRNLKSQVSEIPDSWLDAWQDVDYVRYKFNDSVAEKGESEARWHIGVIAQDIYEKFENHGLNAFEIGLLCYDKWDEYTDANGNIVPSGEIWSIRPDECQFLEMALNRREIKKLKSGIFN